MVVSHDLLIRDKIFLMIIKNVPKNIVVEHGGLATRWYSCAVIVYASGEMLCGAIYLQTIFCTTFNVIDRKTTL